MHSRSILRNILLTLGLVFVLSSFGHAVVSNRITSAITEARTPLQNTVSPRVKSSIDLGAAPASLKLEALTMRFSMTDAQQAALTQLLIDQQNQSSPRYHQWLTSQQFGEQFGLSAADISKVSSWLTAQGFTVTGVAKSSTFITFSGTVAQVQQALGVTVHSVSRNGQRHIANLTDPSLPAAIAGVVSNISGLSDFRAQPHLRTRQVSANAIRPENTITTNNGTAHFMAPGDVYTIYDLNPLLTNGFNGTGINIAVMGQVNLNSSAISDITAFRAAAKLDTTNLPTTTLYGVDPGSPTPTCISNPSSNCKPGLSDLEESLLDVEWAGAVAPAAQILFVTSQDVIETSLFQAIDNNLAPIMTISYGACESAFPASELNTINLVLEEANAKGITIFAPSGDDGATDCDSGVASATQGLVVDFPASSPYVTALGGTMFNEGAGSYWNSANGASGGSATSYIPETAWNETSTNITHSPPSFGAGGGGASAFFAKPAWQTGNGVPNDFSRDVPDVALNAASGHDGYLVCALSSCTGGNFYNSTTDTGNVFGGTSVTAPSLAGVTALIEQSLGGGRLGNINPTLYALANSSSYNSIFHDVISGNNDSPCTAGSRNCPNVGSIGYSAGSGYDQATGWGSIDASVLANSWKTATPISFGQLTSLTTVAANPTSVTAGATISLSITVAAGASSPTTPTGAIQILVDGTAVASSSTALSNGSATYSLNTTNFSSGTHVISAVYSGDSTFSSSKGATNINITSAAVGDFTITPSTASTSAQPGGTAAGVIFTLTPVNGFTGSITLSASTNQALAAGYVFSVNPVALSSTTGVPTTFTLSAFQSNANIRGKIIPLRLASNHPPTGKASWYLAGSGATLACMFLLVLPRRRGWGALLAVVITIGIMGAGGCASNSSSTSSGSGSGTSPTSPSVTNSAPGTYVITVTAVASSSAGTLSHNATVSFTVQ